MKKKDDILMEEELEEEESQVAASTDEEDDDSEPEKPRKPKTVLVPKVQNMDDYLMKHYKASGGSADHQRLRQQVHRRRDGRRWRQRTQLLLEIPRVRHKAHP